MPTTPLTTEARAIAFRLNHFTAFEGNAVTLRQMIYQDSATVTELRGVIETDGGAPELADGLIPVATRLGNAGETGGHIMWHAFMQEQAAPLLAAIDYVEALPEPEPEAPAAP